MPSLLPEEVAPEPVARVGAVYTAPTTTTGPFQVIVSSFDETHVYEIRYWMPRGETLPKVGNRVLVVEDETGEPWVIAWWPV